MRSNIFQYYYKWDGWCWLSRNVNENRLILISLMDGLMEEAGIFECLKLLKFQFKFTENTTIPFSVRTHINLNDPANRLLTQLYWNCKLLAQKANESETHGEYGIFFHNFFFSSDVHKNIFTQYKQFLWIYFVEKIWEGP